MLLACARTLPAFPTGDDSAVGEALNRVFRELRPSLVQVIAYRPTGPSPSSIEGFGKITRLEPNRATVWATGIVLDAGGLVMTCAEAAQPGDSLEVRLGNGERIGAHFLGQSASLGASLIRVDHAAGLIPVPRLTRPPCQKGNWVLVLNFSATDGKPDLRLGTLRSIVPAGRGLPEYLRVSLADCRGTCGGALVDGHGRFRGMVLDVRAEHEGQMGSASQVDYADLLQCDTVQAISFTELFGLCDSLQAASAHAVGFLGIHAEEGDDFSSPDDGPGKSAARTVRVVRVLPGGPAEIAGIMAGDEILEIGGHPVRNADEITRRVAVIKPGTEVQVKVLRRGVPLVFTPRLVDRSSLEWLLREAELNATRQKRIRRSIQQLQDRLQELEQERSRFQ